MSPEGCEGSQRCDILLAVIGEQWLDIRFKEGPQQGQRRLDDPGDFVRIEIQAALERNIPFIPVLVGRQNQQENPRPLQKDRPGSLLLRG
jgi:hypothetical protein